jgi:hypothetical protein
MNAAAFHRDYEVAARERLGREKGRERNAQGSGK